MKKYINYAFIYAILGLASGVFYREFTKFHDFTGKTALSVTHVHFLTLGTLFFLITALFVLNTNLEEQKGFKAFVRIHNIALPFMVIMFYVRGITQVLGTNLSRGLDASISGMAGIVHILMAVGIVFFFRSLKKATKI